jgi:hypothetical protein
MNARALLTGVAVVVALSASRGLAVEPDTAGIRTNDGFAGLSLRVSDETAPPGSIVQIKIDVTEPKPISTGRGKIKIKGLAPVEGIVLMNRDQDTYGVAMVDGDELSFAIHSPSSLFGTPTDYPIVAIAGRVAANAGIGTTYPLQLDPGALRFVTPAGADYPLEIKDGQLTVGNSVVISDVSPGSSIVPAGGTVHISGTNFVPDTRLQLSETSIAAVHYISSTRMDVVLAQAADMHGVRIRARNPDKSESEYFSYERTKSTSPSNDRILSRTVPLFAPATYMTATVPLPRLGGNGGRRRAVGHSLPNSALAANAGISAQQASGTVGFALQNLGTSDVSASIELLDSHGFPYATNTVTIGPDRYLVREISEVFGLVVSPSAVRVRSSAPLQVLGLVTDRSADTAMAVAPNPSP